MIDKVFSFSVLIFLLAACNVMPVTSQRAKDFFPAIYGPSYVQGTSDIPVYKGYRIRSDDSVFYDTAKGRIVEARYIGKNIDHKDVIHFYNETLQQIGWKEEKANRYRREQEMLDLKLTKLHDNTSEMKITIQPK